MEGGSSPLGDFTQRLLKKTSSCRLDSRHPNSPVRPRGLSVPPAAIRGASWVTASFGRKTTHVSYSVCRALTRYQGFADDNL